MDDLSCIGNESSLMNCDFSGWGIHDCQNGEVRFNLKCVIEFHY